MSEVDFLAALVRRSDCGLLLDVNNLYVSAHNVGINPSDYLATLPPAAIGEFHVAGHATNRIGNDVVLIDDHGSRVSDEVWALYAAAIQQYGHRPTLVEWDTNLPTLDVLVGEAQRVRDLFTGSKRSAPC